MKKMSIILASMFIGLMVGMSLAPAVDAQAINVIETACQSANGANEVCKNKDNDLNTTIKDVINLMLYGVGIISVVAIIIGGIYYTMSTGDQGKIQNAKNTILYAVIGLIVAIMAFAIVNFVVANIG